AEYSTPLDDSIREMRRPIAAGPANMQDRSSVQFTVETRRVTRESLEDPRTIATSHSMAIESSGRDMSDTPLQRSSRTRRVATWLVLIVGAYLVITYLL